jgi:hypothetical protein
MLIIITSCQSTKFYIEDFIGEYKCRINKLAYNFDYKLILNADTTFYLQIDNQKCTGRWNLLSKNEAILTCNGANGIDALSSGYLSQRKYAIKWFKSDSLKLTIYNLYLPSIPLLYQSSKKQEVILKIK